MYQITFKKSALKELSDISKPYNQNIAIAIGKLAETPRPHGVKKI
jgi:mRNA-degrading endonuclease RelE of RelBE toxin-antitoxin system